MELLMWVWDWQVLASAEYLQRSERRHPKTELPRFLDAESRAAFLWLFDVSSG